MKGFIAQAFRCLIFIVQTKTDSRALLMRDELRMWMKPKSNKGEFSIFIRFGEHRSDEDRDGRDGG